MATASRAGAMDTFLPHAQALYKRVATEQSRVSLSALLVPFCRNRPTDLRFSAVSSTFYFLVILKLTSVSSNCLALQYPTSLLKTNRTDC